jgi:hypothetical protein
MTSIVGVRAVAIAVILSLSSGCAGGPDFPPPGVGASLEEVQASQAREAHRPVFAFEAEGHVFALHRVDEKGALDESGTTGGSLLVFEDDRFLGALERNEALDYSACLAQPDGRTLLAERLRTIASGGADRLAQQEADATVGDRRCPKGSDGSPPVDEARKETFLGALGQSLLLSAGLVLSPILIPAAAGYAGGAAAHDRPSLEAQEKVALAMSVEDVVALMGEPKATFLLMPAGTEVRYWERSVSPPFWVGLEDAQVVWLRFDATDRWLNDVKKRLSAAATAPPQE